MVSGPWVVGSCAFEADPAVLSGVADCFGSCFVVACIVRSVWLGMESVVVGLAGRAAAWAGGQIATV
jgi:hypothetical protein